MTGGQDHLPAVPTGAKFSDWLVRPLLDTEVDAYIALFKEVFSAVATPEEWQWKYGDTRGLSLGLWKPDGTLVGHYGVTNRPYQTGNRTFNVVHAGDVMMSPSVRGVFSKRGPFHMLTDGIIDRCFGEHGFAEFGFGIPNKRHFTLGEILGHYWELETLWDIRIAATTSPASVEYLIRRIESGDASVACSQLASMPSQPHLRESVLMPHRAPDWLKDRYIRHPSKAYVVYRIEQQGPNDVMYVVVRDLPVTARENIECLEWFSGSDCRVDIGQALQSLATELGANGVMVWGTSPVLTALQASNVVVVGTEICKVAAAQSTIIGQSTQAWHGRFWLTGADTDFR